MLPCTCLNLMHCNVCTPECGKATYTALHLDLGICQVHSQNDSLYFLQGLRVGRPCTIAYWNVFQIRTCVATFFRNWITAFWPYIQVIEPDRFCSRFVLHMRLAQKIQRDLLIEKPPEGNVMCSYVCSPLLLTQWFSTFIDGKRERERGNLA